MAYVLDCETVAGSSITIQLIPYSYNLLKFIYVVVVSPAGGNGMKSGVARIKCQCKLGEDIKASWLNTDVSELNSDHVYVWYDPFHCDSILKFYQSKICFEFYVTNATGEFNGSIGIKECGVRQVSIEELESILPELELDSQKEEELKKAVELESEHIITLEPIQKHSLSISLDSGDTTQVHENLQEKENLDDDHKSKEIMKSKILHKSISLKKVDSTGDGYDVEGFINKETKCLSNVAKQGKMKARQNIQYIEPTKESTKFNSTGNEGRSMESEAALHLPLVLTVEGNDSDNKSSENNYGWQDNFDETKNQEEKPNIQGGQITVSDINDLISEPEQEKENAPIIDFSKHEDGSDDDLFAELDSILLGSQGEKKKVDADAKNLITESKELIASIKKSKPSYTAALSKQQKLKNKWEGFRIEFADNYGCSSS